MMSVAQVVSNVVPAGQASNTGIAISGWWMGQHVRHEGKEVFATAGQAAGVLAWYQSHGRAWGARGLVVYQCVVCGQWFLGHYAGDNVQCTEV